MENDKVFYVSSVFPYVIMRDIITKMRVGESGGVGGRERERGRE